MENQFNWKSFVYDINCRSLAIVIGRDLSVLRLRTDLLSDLDFYSDLVNAGYIDGEYLYINLYKYLAIKMWGIHGEGKVPRPVTINNVVLALRNQKKSENVFYNFLKKEINDLTDDQIMLEPFRKLARISGLETFVTVNIDNFLERAFKAENIRVNSSFNFSVPFPAIDPGNKKDPGIASIFNLMGNIKEYDFAMTDEQSLEYTYEIQKGSDAFAKTLFEAINQKDILFAGSSLPDWFMRFFIRIISKEPFKTSKKAKYVACDNLLDDEELLAFLENNATQVIPIGTNSQNGNGSNGYKSTAEFIDKIYTQCEKGIDSIKKIRYQEKFFISYSRDDKLLAERFRNEFQKKGLDVFYDEDSLQTGDLYNKKIKNAIRDCNYFVALISENSIKDEKRYVYDKEWRYAIYQYGEKDSSLPYIFPFIIDRTEDTDNRIPEDIRQLNIKRITDFDNLGEVFEGFLRQISLTRLTQ